MGTVIIKGDGLKNLKNIKNGVLAVGWFASARYPDKNSTPVAEIATQNEYGNPNKNIPARPFMAPTIVHNENAWKQSLSKGFNAVIDGKTTTQAVLENFGGQVVGQIQESISQVFTPVLKRRTIEARLARGTHSGRLTKVQAEGITKPLIDTGHMYDTVSYEILSK